jgi:tRNA U34 5-methylaminomethyl-2-thiouridine-forming methyltransferase MnmC
VLLYDAYCAPFDGPLWEEAFLEAVLDRARPQVVASYAATSALKRALLSRGFRLRKRPGFGGKRECTFGWRASQ